MQLMAASRVMNCGWQQEGIGRAEAKPIRVPAEHITEYRSVIRDYRQQIFYWLIIKEVAQKSRSGTGKDDDPASNHKVVTAQILCSYTWMLV